jgi:hypothetical protein
MPIIISADQPSVQVAGRTRDQYEIVTLSEEQKGEVIYRKLESMNAEICDTVHDINHPWVEEFTDIPKSLKRLGIAPRISIGSETKNRPMSSDEGYILRFHGTFDAEVAFIDRRIVPTDEADDMIELGTIDDYDRYNYWVFRLFKIIKTNGPELTRQKQELEEVQKQRSEDKLMGTIEQAITNLAKKFSNDPNDIPDGQSGLVQMLSQMSEGERADLFVEAELEADIVQTNLPGETGE